MAIITVDREDTFSEWREKTNAISESLGDAATLDTVATDAVGAINEVYSSIGDTDNLLFPADDVVEAINAAARYSVAITLALG